MARSKAAAIKRQKEAIDEALRKRKETDTGDIKKRRWKPGTVAAREVRRYQGGKFSTRDVLPRKPIERLVKEILQEVSTKGSMRMTKNAFNHLYSMTQEIGTSALAAAERVRASEGKVQSIRTRHLRIGRGLIGVDCLSDSKIPLELMLRKPSSKKHKVKRDKTDPKSEIPEHSQNSSHEEQDESS